MNFKYSISWVFSICIFIIFFVIIGKTIINYFQDPLFLMIGGIITYYISDKISGIALLNFLTSIETDNIEEIN